MTDKARRAWRVPVLVFIVAFVAAALVIARTDEPAPLALLDADVGALAPTLSPPSSPSSSWYCAAGSAWGSTDARPVPTTSTTRPTTTTAGSGSTVGTGVPSATVPTLPPAPPIVAEQTVSVANLGDSVREVVITVVPSEGDSVRGTRSLGPRSRLDVAVSDLAEAPAASVLVEADGGDVGVEHRVAGPAGTAVAPCLSRTAAQWFFPAGTTRLGSRLVYAVFNPFPDDAVLDVSFETSEGTRSPGEFDGLVIPAGRVRNIDVTDVVTVRDQLSTVVRARSGQVAVEQLQIFDGDDDPGGITLVPGSPGAAPIWTFAAGPQFGEGVDTSYVVFNPGQGDAEVSVEVHSDAPGTLSTITPYEVKVRRGQYSVVDLAQDGRIPEGYGHWAVVRATNGATVVAQRVVRASAPAAATGWSVVTGAPTAATRWAVPIGGLTSLAAGAVEITNPGALPAALTVRSTGGGTTRVLEQFDAVALAPGARTVVDLTTLGEGTELSLVVESDEPLVVERTFTFADGQGQAATVALAWRDAQVVPDPTLFGLLPSTTVPAAPGGIDPGQVPLPGVDDTAPGGTDPATTAAEGTTVDGTAPSGTAPEGSGAAPPDATSPPDPPSPTP
jgi:hypothetical protein